MTAGPAPRRIGRLLAAGGLLLGLAGAGAPQASAQACPQGMDGQPLPVEATAQFMPDPGWQKQVNFLAAGLQTMDLTNIRLLFIGDSITANWQKDLFAQFYGTRNALNLGLSGESTQGLLWRLQHGPLGTSLKPELVVLLIGTNDLWPGADASHVALGIATVVRQIRHLSPGSHVLLLGLLPRGAAADDPFRSMIRQVNAMIGQCTEGDRVIYADPGALLVDGHGVLPDAISTDHLHPSWLGYAIMAAALEPDVSRVLGPR